MGTLIELGAVRSAQRVVPKGCKGAACPAFATCQGRCAAKLSLRAVLSKAVVENQN